MMRRAAVDSGATPAGDCYSVERHADGLTFTVQHFRHPRVATPCCHVTITRTAAELDAGELGAVVALARAYQAIAVQHEARGDSSV